MALQFLSKNSAVIKTLAKYGSENNANSVFRGGNPIFQPAKRNASIHTSNWLIKKIRAEHITAFGWTLLAVPISTLGLGVWQIQRKKWKLSLINQLRNETTKPPVELSDKLDDLDQAEYRQVRVRGTFLHDKELYLGPRTFIGENSNTTKGQVFSSQNPGSGFLVITPLKLEGRDETILVNRGWVPRNKLDPNTRPGGQPSNVVELIGIVRKGEARPQFTPKAKGSHFLYRDIQRMANLTGAEPFYIDANVQSTVDGGPIGGQTMITIRDEHLTYVVTWLSLSGFTSLFWYKLVYLAK